MFNIANRHYGKPRPIKHRGLTLVELLVAISVLGFVAVLGWRGLDSIVRARIALSSELEQTRGMQITFAQLQSDCARLADNSVLLKRVSLAATPTRLIMVRRVFAENQPSRLQVISYRVKDGVLTRRESLATRDLIELDALWQASVNDLDTTRAVVLQSDVTAMTIRTWNSSSWGTSLPTPPGQNFSAPTGLEVTLQLHGQDNGLKKIFLLGAV